MIDARFETDFDDVQDLLTGVDIDELGDLETLLTVLFSRPVGVEEVWEDDSASTALEVVISGNESAIGTTDAFPMSVVQLVRECAETVHELGPYDGDDDSGLAGEAPDVLTMPQSALLERCLQALGQVRLLSMMKEGD